MAGGEGSWDKIVSDLKNSNTVYVGNLSLATREEHLLSVFKTCGDIVQVALVNRFVTLQPLHSHLLC